MARSEETISELKAESNERTTPRERKALALRSGLFSFPIIEGNWRGLVVQKAWRLDGIFGGYEGHPCHSAETGGCGKRSRRERSEVPPVPGVLILAIVTADFWAGRKSEAGKKSRHVGFGCVVDPPVPKVTYFSVRSGWGIGDPVGTKRLLTDFRQAPQNQEELP